MLFIHAEGSRLGRVSMENIHAPTLRLLRPEADFALGPKNVLTASPAGYTFPSSCGHNLPVGLVHSAGLYTGPKLTDAPESTGSARVRTFNLRITLLRRLACSAVYRPSKPRSCPPQPPS